MATTARGQAPSKFMYFVSNPKVRNEKKHLFLTRRLEIKKAHFDQTIINRFYDFDFPDGLPTWTEGGGWGGLDGVV